MRDYSQVRARFWTRGTGKALPPMGKLVALHLLTSPSSNMLGLYYLPVALLAHETGLDPEGASEGLRRCIEGGFAKYDEETSCVWVVNMAREQLLGDEESLHPGDRRVRGVENLLKTLEEHPFYSEFVQHYRDSLCIGRYQPPEPKTKSKRAPLKGLRRGFEGPSKPENRDQRTEIREGESARARAAPPEPITEPQLARPTLVAVKPEPLRFLQPLQDAVRSAFFARGVSPPKASPSQWRDGCQTVQDALDLGAYPDAHAAIAAYAELLVASVAGGKKLGFALQEVTLAGKLEPEGPRAPSGITADGRTEHAW